MNAVDRRDLRPPQVRPVQRPHRTAPHTTIDVVDGALGELLRSRLELMHGANHNDPGPWAPPDYDVRRAQR